MIMKSKLEYQYFFSHSSYQLMIGCCFHVLVVYDEPPFIDIFIILDFYIQNYIFSKSSVFQKRKNILVIFYLQGPNCFRLFLDLILSQVGLAQGTLISIYLLSLLTEKSLNSHIFRLNNNSNLSLYIQLQRRSINVFWQKPIVQQ